MNITLGALLSLVGKLDDASGQDTPRERFRKFLTENVTTVGSINDYIEECLRNSGDQYNRALQDLVNFIGRMLGFEVTFGRYAGIVNQIGFDGLWKSPSGLYIVVEAKTTDVYAIKTSILLNYVHELISDKRIPDTDHALGLYVIGRQSPNLYQLQNAIIAEKLTHRLRTISASSLVSLAGLIAEYDITHEDILAILKPSGASIDGIADLIAKVLAQRPVSDPVIVRGEELQTPVETIANNEGVFWLAPAKDDETMTSDKWVEVLVGQEKIWAIGERNPARKNIKQGDMICFYASGLGVVAYGTVSSGASKEQHPAVKDPENYGWVFHLSDTHLLKDPIAIDAELRLKLEAFNKRDPDKNWSWFVQSIHKITQHDFRVLTTLN